VDGQILYSGDYYGQLARKQSERLALALMQCSRRPTWSKKERCSKGGPIVTVNCCIQANTLID
jgi:hypothetical protein